MKLYRHIFLLVFEISVSIFVIIFSYAVWNNFDKSTYDIALLNDKIKMVEHSIQDNKLYLHNKSKSDNKVNLIIKIDKNDIDFENDLVLSFNNGIYNLNKTEYSEDDIYYYFNVDNINFYKYETKDYEFDINNKDLDYEFITI